MKLENNRANESRLSSNSWIKARYNIIYNARKYACNAVQENITCQDI